MRFLKRTLLLCIVLGLNSVAAQEKVDKDKLIEEIKSLMLEHYVFLDKAEETNAHLDELNKQGEFDAYDEPGSLAEELTRQMRVITNDKHLSVRLNNTNAIPTEVDIERELNRYYRPAIREMKYVDGNVAYANIGFFGGSDNYRRAIDGLMEQLNQADAIIIDMRTSHGGSPSGVQYFCSYFFTEKILLNTIYRRSDDHTEEFWSMDVEDVKRPDVPLFILTSSRTFSAAEDFPYTLQSQKRATIIGEVTRGGAHPTRGFPLPYGFRIGIPSARSINPITGTNWEGTGIAPDIEIAADKSYEHALNLARIAASEYKSEILIGLDENLTNGNGQKLSEHLSDLVSKNITTENEINLLGYRYMQINNIPNALALLKANTELFPDSPNTYDSYAESLAANGQMKQALTNYKKAVALAEEQQHEWLDSFRDNLARFEKSMR